MKKEIKVTVKVKDGFVSVNALYAAKLSYSGGRPHAQMYKNPKAAKAERAVRDQLKAIDFSEYMDFLRETKKFKLLIQVIMKNNIGRKDCSNYIKNLEDIWTRFVHDDLGIETYDDRLHVEVHAYKATIPGLEEEIACIQLTESNFNMRFDQIQKPEQALVHISENQDTSWEKEFKKKAKEKGLKYQLSTTDKKIKDHNTDIFFVDVSSPTWSADIMDLMDWIYSHKESGFTFYGFMGGTSQEFTDRGQQVIDKINEFGISSIKAEWIKTESDILTLIQI